MGEEVEKVIPTHAMTLLGVTQGGWLERGQGGVAVERCDEGFVFCRQCGRVARETRDVSFD